VRPRSAADLLCQRAELISGRLHGRFGLGEDLAELRRQARSLVQVGQAVVRMAKGRHAAAQHTDLGLVESGQIGRWLAGVSRRLSERRRRRVNARGRVTRRQPQLTENEGPGAEVNQVALPRWLADADVIGIHADRDDAFQTRIDRTPIDDMEPFGGLVLEEHLGREAKTPMIFPIPSVQVDQRSAQRLEFFTGRADPQESPQIPGHAGNVAARMRGRDEHDAAQSSASQDGQKPPLSFVQDLS